MSWKATIYKTYKALEKLAKEGHREVGVVQLSLATGYSPTYLRYHVIPVLVETFSCIKREKGKIIFECKEEEKHG